MGRDSVEFDIDFHTTAMSAIDAAVSGFGDDDKIGFDFIFFDDIFPAEAVAIFFHNGEGEVD